ncbi:MAG: ABC transporter permease [Acidobacteria bacterium]|nr:ABC transporter permease [Acidobacteriota bacterium]
MQSFSQQLRQVLRRLRLSPLFTTITLITLAAGIGANTLVFSVVEGVLLKPLPYPDPNRLVGVWHTAPGIQIKDLNMAPSHYFIYREQGNSFQDIAMYQGDSFSVTGLNEPEQVDGLDVTDTMFSILGVTPVAGRLFSAEDAQPNAPKTAILGYGYWMNKFGGDRSVVGRTIMTDGDSRLIVGVLPRSFHFLDYRDPSVVIPYQFDRSKMKLGNYSYNGLARLKPGVTLEQANADVARMLPIVMNSFPAPEGFSIKLFENAHIGPQVRPLKQDVVGDIGNVLWVVMGSIGLVMLIVCANVANLVLVRTESRRQELALRAALGAGRGRIAGELFLESAILGLLGSIVGLAIAYIGLRILTSVAPENLPRIREIGIDGPVLLFTLVVTLIASALFACIPILKYAGVRLSTGIREGGRALSASREQHRARNVLVVVQVALALVLLICSGLMIRTFHAMTKVNPGFTNAEQLQTFHIMIPDSQIKSDEAALRMEQEIQNRLAAIPGTNSVALDTAPPMGGNQSNDPVLVEGRSYAEGEFPALRRFKFVGPGAFATLGIPMIAGRDYTWDDIYQNHLVTIVSENTARELFQDPQNAVGKRVRVATTDPFREIIGVVGNVHDDGISEKAPTSVYWPVMMKKFEGQDSAMRRYISYIIRNPHAGSETLMKDVRAAVWSVNPNLPLADVHTIQYFYDRSLARTTFTLIMIGVAGSMALLLGVVGLYGVIAYSVSQRKREIGIRMAIGAQTKELTNMFVRHGLILTGIGVACGLVAALILMRFMASILFGVSPIDPITYIAVSAGLAATALLASYVPSRRAAAVDPVDALRAE